MGKRFKIETAIESLVSFISGYTARAGINRLVVGLSGGVDSSVSAVLGAKAIGAKNILGIVMPYNRSSSESENDAVLLAETFGIAVEKIDISPMVDSYFMDKEVSMLRRGNKCARERMSILFDVASRDNRLVLGTSNKTEISLGYATWYGDSACSFDPLAGLYKREVWEIARYFGLPEVIIEKKPTADLWPGQTDEEELGLSYKMADNLLYQIIEIGETRLKELLQTGADEKIIKLVIGRINEFSFKRSLPAIELLGGKPIPNHITVV